MGTLQDQLQKRLGAQPPKNKSQKDHKKKKFQNPKRPQTKESKIKSTSFSNACLYYYSGDTRSARFGRDICNYPIVKFIDPNNKFEDCQIHKSPYKSYFHIDKSKGFELKTTYPGLLVGAGYMHPVSEKNEEDFQLGFYFDWTTGVPVIPGSTVKGVLRSVFPGDDKNDEIIEEKCEYLVECADLGNIENKIKFIKKLEINIFEKKGDVFFDAFIPNNGIPNNGKIFAEDYITPHPHPFKNPKPIRFLKIGPDVIFKFQFHLKDSRIKLNNKDFVDVKVETKEKLFKKILKDFGIGAKRNTGYGVLIDV